MFPQLQGTRSASVNLDDEAVRWRSEHPEVFSGGPNPLLDPVICQRMVDDVHRREGLAWSYGGYLENRRNLWAGHYLEKTGNFVHLGVDCNAPLGTRVAVDFPARVILVDHDPDRDGGWGGRVFVATNGPVFVYAHLQNMSVAPGQILSSGAVLAEVGGPPDNGNWFQHLHVQAIRAELFRELQRGRLHELDGYGHPSRIVQFKHDFPDPLPYLGL